MLEIENLQVSIDEKPILNGISLTVQPGEIHAIMGPNGAGKSTLAKVMAGHPSYEITGGDIRFMGQSILEVEPEERAHLGIFVSFQYPIEIQGISNFQFLHATMNAKRKAVGESALPEEEFRQMVMPILNQMQIKQEFLDRDINSGFSGGEKKRNEILQMAVLNPRLAVLDETDSGLDIDALKTVAAGINQEMSQDKGLILITHYQRLLDYVQPHFVHVVIDGKVLASGGPELAQKLESQGYDWLHEKVHA